MAVAILFRVSGFGLRSKTRTFTEVAMTNKIPVAQIGKMLDEVRTQSPLIHNITNYVVMGLTANALLAIGASPVMAHAEEEVEEMVGIAGALVINLDFFLCMSHDRR